MVPEQCSTKQSQLINKSSDLMIKLFDTNILLVQHRIIILRLDILYDGKLNYLIHRAH